jgi:hypothetical protein
MKNIILLLFQKYFISKLRKISVINFSIVIILLFLITLNAKAFAQKRCESDDRGHAFCAPLAPCVRKDVASAFFNLCVNHGGQEKHPLWL